MAARDRSTTSPGTLPPPAPLGPVAAGHVADQPLAAREQVAQKLAQARPLLAVAVALMLGIALGGALPSLALWLALAAGAAAMVCVMMRRQRDAGVRAWGLVLIVPLGAVWLILSSQYTDRHDIARYLTPGSQLAQVTGTVRDDVHHSSPRRGAFGHFSYRTPATLFTLEVDTILIDGQPQPASGALLVRIQTADYRIQPGQRVRAAGWLMPFGATANPGESDFRQMMAEQGVRGRLHLASQDNWQPLPPAQQSRSLRSYFDGVRRGLSGAMRDSLRLGLLDRPRELALLEALLLGQWAAPLQEIHESFRRVGLAHLLSISGAHLGILLGLTWALLRLFVHRPSRAAALLLLVLGLYMMAVPLRVPIVRAAIMAAMFCVGYATGRGVTAVGMLALAAVVVLIWQPMDLFSPGFQLSFGIVAALLLFVQPVSHWLWRPPPAHSGPMSLMRQWLRWGVDYLAVSLVAFVVALPVVAYHFQMISPLAVLLSLLALPPVVAMLGLGYLKMVLGLAWPSASLALAWPLAQVTQAMLWLVEWSAGWRIAGVQLSQPPSLLWVTAALAVAVAMLAGWYARRRIAMTLCVALLVGWAVAMDRYPQAESLHGLPGPAAMRLNMISVGHGSSFLVRLTPTADGDEAQRPYVMLYDCGSQSYLDVAERTIVPALRELGVRHIDALFISHADLDHFSGVLDLADALPIGRVLVPPQLLEEAGATPHGATAYLVAQLRERGLTIEPAHQGWRETHGGAALELLWPAPDTTARRSNDTSLVLSLRVAGRRMLFTGDIEEPAIRGLLNTGVDLRADVAEMPHHGGFDEGSHLWLDVVQPGLLLQSTGIDWADRDPDRDPWQPLLHGRATHRLVTARDGMVELIVRPDGRIEWVTFRNRTAQTLCDAVSKQADD